MKEASPLRLASFSIAYCCSSLQQVHFPYKNETFSSGIYSMVVSQSWQMSTVILRFLLELEYHIVET